LRKRGRNSAAFKLNRRQNYSYSILKKDRNLFLRIKNREGKKRKENNEQQSNKRVCNSDGTLGKHFKTNL
jgi:Ser/Thr protein kinase RdoA (MazF antagonist)